jgi:hypothetical protein
MNLKENLSAEKGCRVRLIEVENTIQRQSLGCSPKMTNTSYFERRLGGVGSRSRSTYRWMWTAWKGSERRVCSDG